MWIGRACGGLPARHCAGHQRRSCRVASSCWDSLDLSGPPRCLVVEAPAAAPVGPLLAACHSKAHDLHVREGLHKALEGIDYSARRCEEQCGANLHESCFTGRLGCKIGSNSTAG